MIIKIFCEAGKAEGLGHLMRCYRLKNLLLHLGHEVFIYQSGEEESLMCDFHCEWKDENQMQILLEKTDIAVIDSYQAKESLYHQVATSVKKLIILDDNQRIPYPQTAIILNGALKAQNLYANPQDHLIGIEFLILDKQFFCTKIPRPSIQHLLITLGGTDPTDTTQKILTILKDKPYTLHIVSRKTIQTPKSQQIKFYCNLSSSEMAGLMRECDAAISAGGGTLNELAMSQVPTLIIPTASNQIFQAKNWEKIGAMKITSLSGILRDLDTISPMEKRQEMISKYKNIPFGKLLAQKLQKILSEI